MTPESAFGRSRAASGSSHVPHTRNTLRRGLSREASMSILTYTDLQSAIGNWLARSDLSANIPDFITLAEQRIFYGADDPNFPSPPLRIRAMEQVTDPTSFLTTAGT